MRRDEAARFRTVTATTFTNSGMIEASARAKPNFDPRGQAERATLQIDAGATLVLAATAATTNTVTFNGAGAELTLDQPAIFRGRSTEWASTTVSTSSASPPTGQRQRVEPARRHRERKGRRHAATVREQLRIRFRHQGGRRRHGHHFAAGPGDSSGLSRPNVPRSTTRSPAASRSPTQRRTSRRASTRSTIRTSTRSPSPTMA